MIISSFTFSQEITSDKRVSREFSPDSIFHLIKKVADWQLDSIRKNGWSHPERDWTNGALYTGLLKFGEIANDVRYYKFLKENVGEKYNWMLQTDSRRYHADYYCVGQMYSRLYQIYKDPKMIADLKSLADTLIARPHMGSLEFSGEKKSLEWVWCDALFMAPPALTMLASVIGEKKYMDICDKLWWRTTDYLYDKDAHLYFRDSQYFTEKEKNGKKVFWSRGNGWVMGGLVKVIEIMPKDYPERERWVTLYKEMAVTIAGLQQADGSWHASLLDPASFPEKETSGTGFFCYALAWGINHGLLDAKTYSPIVWKAWLALAGCVHPEGKLGYVQQIGAAPDKVSYDDTEVYGVGAFLSAGSEMIEMAMGNRKFKPDLSLTNTEGTPQTLGDLLSSLHQDKKGVKTYRNILTGEKMTVSSDIAGATTIYLKAVR
jgi:rhamnogalacturonyl hydrolase YesR